MIKSKLMGGSEFVCTSWDNTDAAAVFRGRFSPAMFVNLQSRLENHIELRDCIQFFLVQDNECLPPLYANVGYYRRKVSKRGIKLKEGPPLVIIALPKKVVPEQETERGSVTKSVAVLSTMLAAFTTIAYALSSWALNPIFFNSIVNENDATALTLCLPIFIGVLAVSALHEAGHIVTAKKHRVKLGLPVPLPSLQVSVFGSITPLHSFPPS